MSKILGRIASLVIVPISRCQRALLCTSKRVANSVSYRGSVTVEAAVVLPLFLLAALSLVSVFDICAVQTKEQTRICQNAKKLAVYAYGVSEDAYIDLAEVETHRLAVSMIPGYTVPIALRGRVHAWIGRTEEECLADQNTVGEDFVFVTDHESVYHTDEMCSHLKLSIYSVEASELSHQRNENGGKYHSCDKCCGETVADGVYYISPYGSSYHSSRECSGLSRNVRVVKKSDMSHLAACSRCGGT